ncbi:MAG: ribosome silencing factor [Erysipelotrichales bacterium]
MNEVVRSMANLLEDKHAKDIEIFEVGAAHPMFDNVIVASVDVSRNLEAIISEVKKFEKEGKIDVKAYDVNNKEWVLIDLYDVMIHVMVKDARHHYDLDSILAEYVERSK